MLHSCKRRARGLRRIPRFLRGSYVPASTRRRWTRPRQTAARLRSPRATLCGVQSAGQYQFVRAPAARPAPQSPLSRCRCAAPRTGCRAGSGAGAPGRPRTTGSSASSPAAASPRRSADDRSAAHRAGRRAGSDRSAPARDAASPRRRLTRPRAGAASCAARAGRAAAPTGQTRIRSHRRAAVSAAATACLAGHATDLYPHRTHPGRPAPREQRSRASAAAVRAPASARCPPAPPRSPPPPAAPRRRRSPRRSPPRAARPRQARRQRFQPARHHLQGAQVAAVDAHQQPAPRAIVAHQFRRELQIRLVEGLEQHEQPQLGRRLEQRRIPRGSSMRRITSTPPAPGRARLIHLVGIDQEVLAHGRDAAPERLRGLAQMREFAIEARRLGQHRDRRRARQRIVARARADIFAALRVDRRPASAA